MERPNRTRPSRSPINTVLILLMGVAIGYAVYPVVQSLRSPNTATKLQDGSEATTAIAFPEEPFDPVIWPGRHLVITVPGASLDADTRRLLAFVRPGMVVLRDENLVDRDQVKALVKDIKAAVGLGTDDTALPLIAVDLREVNLQILGLQQAPSVATLASMGDAATARKLGRTYAAEYAQLGIAVVFTPVLDIFDPAAFAADEDAYDQEHDQATEMAMAYLAGAKAAGVIPVAAGFPGRRAAHIKVGSPVPVLDQDRYQLAKIMYSFIEAVSGADKIPAIMVEHIAVPALDDRNPTPPASLSTVLVQTVLRDKCWYEGVIIADDIALNAAVASEPTERVAVQALAAGCDAVLMLDPDPDKILAVCSAIQTAVFLDTLSRSQLDASKARLDSLQNWLRASDRGMAPSPTEIAKAPEPTKPAVTDSQGQDEDAAEPAPPIVAISKEAAPEEEPGLDAGVPEAPEEIAPEEATAPPTEHVVGEDESLTAIANQYGVTVKNLLTWNNLIDPQVSPGQVLRVVPPEASTEESMEEPEGGESVAANKEESAEAASDKPDETAAETSEAEDAADAGTPEDEPETSATEDGMTTHTIVPGDTLYRIAEKYHTTPERIMDLNNIRDKNHILLNQKLKVPAP